MAVGSFANLVDNVLLGTGLDSDIDTYVNGLASDDSLAGAWKRNLEPGVTANLKSGLKASAAGESPTETEVLTALRVVADEDVSINGGVVTDGGAANSKVNISAGRLLLTSGVVLSFSAASGLDTLDTKTISVNKTTGVISSNTGVPGGNFSLATVAVAAGVCTPTDTRRKLLLSVGV